MRIIISPAKKMNVDVDSFPVRDLPRFLSRAEALRDRLREMEPPALQKLWQCNDKIAALNVERLRSMDLRRNLTPAILSYEGIQYRYMAPGVFSYEELDYVQEHLRILSGFYGLLRPLDGVVPYRLEMQAKLETWEGNDLYTYWGDVIAQEIFSETDCVINLASKEYSLCVSPYVPTGAKIITCVFGEWKDGKIIEKGTLCKMARGEMVRFMAQHQICDPRQMRDFDRLGYRFASERSCEETYVFIKETTEQ